MRVVIIGGGASGMLAAITAAKEGNEVILLEKTSSLGNKIKITGKGRCNVTFDGNIEDFEKNIVKNFKFMYSSFTNFDNKDLVKYINSIGIKTKVERGGRVFPVSDNAQDIVDVLKQELKKYNVKIIYNTIIKEVLLDNGIAVAVLTDENKKISFDKCIIATGGKSYPKTGSDGDGYKLAKKLGHNIVQTEPGLIPLKSNDKVCKALQGLTLKNVSIRVYDNDNVIYEEFGEMLFAHFGLTGPIILSASSKINRIHNIRNKFTNGEIYVIIDMKPAISLETLDKRVQRDFEKNYNREFRNSLNDLLPQKLIQFVIEQSGIDPSKKVNQVTKEERQKLGYIIKNIKVNICGLMPIDIAIITCGGVDVKEINPKTMESKIAKNVFFAGEVLDVDAYTGGFNLQIAFSTAYTAGKN